MTKKTLQLLMQELYLSDYLFLINTKRTTKIRIKLAITKELKIDSEKDVKKLIRGLYKINIPTIIDKIELSITDAAKISLTLPNSLLYSGEITSIIFSNPVFNNSKIITKNETDKIRRKLVLGMFSKIEKTIAYKPIIIWILMFLSSINS